MKKNLLLIFLVLNSFLMEAQQTLPIKRISIFKSGTALISKEGKLSVKEGVARLPVPQEVLFGSYWIGVTKENSVKSLVIRRDTLQKKEESKELWHYLAGNIGKSVTLSLSSKNEKTISGKIVSFQKESMMLKLKQENGKTTLLNAQTVYQVDFNEDENKTYPEDSVQRMILLKPEKATGELALQEVYMQAGINWVPSYLLKLKDDKTARLEMKAIVENVATDIHDAEAELIVGSPQLFFGQKRDPITYDYLTVDESARPEYDARPVQMMSNAMRSQAPPVEAYGGFDSEFSTEGEKESDMYIYKIGRISTPQNGKGSFSVFAAAVDYKDKYEGLIPDKTNFMYSRYIDPAETNYDIYHSLELKNVANVPLTTAPVMVISQKEQFLAQDLLKYTPVNGTVDIKLSKAIDIVMKNAEEEATRTDQAKKIGKIQYSRVTVKGTVNLNNFQNKEVTVIIKKNINGNVLAQSDGAKLLKGSAFNELNPNTTITWEIRLTPNDKKTLTYEYEVYFQP